MHMIEKLKNWWKKTNEEADEKLDFFVMSIFDELIRKPALIAMTNKMIQAEHECRVNLFI